MPMVENDSVQANWSSAGRRLNSIFEYDRQTFANIAVLRLARPYPTSSRLNVVGLFPSPAQSAFRLERKFSQLSRQWKHETGHFSVIARRYQFPAYKAIMDMKSAAIPLILKELKREPDRWFSALQELTGENPAKDAINFYEAVDNWIAWGVSKGMIE
jgi:hypothetical protein